MTHSFNRRDFLTGVAGTALAYAIDAPAQSASGFAAPASAGRVTGGGSPGGAP